MPAALLAGHSWHQLTNEERDALDAALTLQCKTPAAQAALWHPVFNQDFLPARRARVAAGQSASNVS